MSGFDWSALYVLVGALALGLISGSAIVGLAALAILLGALWVEAYRDGWGKE